MSSDPPGSAAPWTGHTVRSQTLQMRRDLCHRVHRYAWLVSSLDRRPQVGALVHISFLVKDVND